MADDYAQRTPQFNLSSKDEIKALKDGKVIFLDVRSDEEYQARKLEGHTVVHIPVTTDDQSGITDKAADLLPNKDVPIVAFCRVGRRANKALQVLESMGYTKLYNGGGLSDLDYLG